jgi:hypothetical protein
MLSKIIILEGPDGGGKTTLANWLRAHHDYKVVKFGPTKPGEDALQTYTDSLLKAVKSKTPTVFDRHYLGETIYGPILRGEDKLGRQGRDLIERLIAACGVRVVICVPPWTRLVEAWQSKDDLLKRVDQLRQVRDAYLVEAKRLSVGTHDWTKRKKLNLETLPTLPDGVTGYPGADILFVGERPGKKIPRWDLPFHCDTGSARYLWESLQNVPWWTEQDAMWTNAFDANGVMRDLRMIVTTSLSLPQRVVALGDAAGQACKRQDVTHVQTPHPQYWRRFHHNDTEGYTNLLKEAIGC